MDLAKIHYEANRLIAEIYGSTIVPENGSVTVIVDGIRYIVYFRKVETGWVITKTNNS